MFLLDSNVSPYTRLFYYITFQYTSIFVDVQILHQTKRRILRELRGRELHGYELAKALNLPITGIYQHLRDLSEGGLIASQVEGRRRLYRITNRGSSLLAVLENGLKDSKRG